MQICYIEISIYLIWRDLRQLWKDISDMKVNTPGKIVNNANTHSGGFPKGSREHSKNMLSHDKILNYSFLL